MTAQDCILLIQGLYEPIGYCFVASLGFKMVRKIFSVV